MSHAIIDHMRGDDQSTTLAIETRRGKGGPMQVSPAELDIMKVL